MNAQEALERIKWHTSYDGGWWDGFNHAILLMLMIMLALLTVTYYAAKFVAYCRERTWSVHHELARRELANAIKKENHLEERGWDFFKEVPK